MLSGSAVHVPRVRSTRRIFPVHAMIFSLRVCLIADLARPELHALETRPIGVDIGDRAGGTCLDAGGIAAAQIALLHLAGVLHVIDGAEWTRDRAHFAADAHVLQDDLGASAEVDANRINGARLQAPRLGALRTR